MQDAWKGLPRLVYPQGKDRHQQQLSERPWLCSAGRRKEAVQRLSRATATSISYKEGLDTAGSAGWLPHAASLVESSGLWGYTLRHGRADVRKKIAGAKFPSGFLVLSQILIWEYFEMRPFESIVQ